MKDILLVISVLLLFLGGGLTGVAGTNYRFRKGKLMVNPMDYKKKEKRLASIGIVLIIAGFFGFILCDKFMK